MLLVNPLEQANSIGYTSQGKVTGRGYEHVKTHWAVAKSQLRRADRDSILPVIQQFCGLFCDLTHQGRAAEVLA